MRKCTNCNATFDDEGSYCPNCGSLTVVTEGSSAGSAPSVKKKSKVWLFAALAVVMVALIAVGVVLVLNKLKRTDPMHQFFSAQAKLLSTQTGGVEGDGNASFEGIMTGEYVFPFEHIATDAEISVGMNGLDADAAKLLKLSLLLKLDADRGLYGADLNYSGNPMLTALLKLTDNELSFYAPELADEYYQVDEKLLLEIEEGGELGFTRIEDERLKASYDEIWKSYSEVFLMCADGSDFSVERKDVVLEGLNKRLDACTVITFTPNEERIAAALKALAEKLKDDERLSDHLLSVIDHYAGSKLAYPLVNSFLDSRGLEKGRGLLPLFEKYADEIAENAERNAKELVERGFKWTVAINADKPVLQRLEDESGVVEWELYGMSYALTASLNEQGTSRIVYSIEKEEGSELYSGSFAAEIGETNIFVRISDFEPERKSAFGISYGRFELELETMPQAIVYEGVQPQPTTVKLELKVGADDRGGTEHLIKLVDITGGFEETEYTGLPIELRIATTDKAPTIEEPDAERVAVTSAEQLEDILEEMSDKLYGVVMRVAFIMAGRMVG